MKIQTVFVLTRKKMKLSGRLEPYLKSKDFISACVDVDAKLLTEQDLFPQKLFTSSIVGPFFRFPVTVFSRHSTRSFPFCLYSEDLFGSCKVPKKYAVLRDLCLRNPVEDKILYVHLHSKLIPQINQLLGQFFWKDIEGILCSNL